MPDLATTRTAGSLLVALAATAILTTSAFADASCKAQADAKGLHGAAQSSFIGKCRKTAEAKCGADAKAKGLHGAAETSFRTKCLKDAGGA